MPIRNYFIIAIAIFLPETIIRYKHGKNNVKDKIQYNLIIEIREEKLDLLKTEGISGDDKNQIRNLAENSLSMLGILSAMISGLIF